MKNNKGITLITLVVTVIILLILASVGTYSGIRAIKLGELNRFTAELKIMQTEVNSMYEKFKNNETINEQEILSIGEEISSNSDIEQQANVVFTQNASGITSSVGYKYYSLETINNLGIGGISQDFFVNIEKRSVVSFQGLEYQGKTYYTLSQLPDGLYNVEYNDENTRINPEMENISVENISDSSWKLTVNNIEFGGYVQKGKIQYQRLGDDYWSESNDKSFIVTEQGVYLIKVIDNAGNESDNIIKYVGNVNVAENMKVTIPGVKEILNDNQITIEYKKQSASTWKNDLTENYFTVAESGMYDIRFTKNSGETDSILVYLGEINFNSSSTNSWDFSVQENNYKLKYKISDKNSSWEQTNNNIAQISEAGTYDFKVIDNNGNESNNILTQYAYVKDGLVLCYDGINNTGTGHSSVATTWKDLSGNNNDGTFTLDDTVTWNADRLKFTNSITMVNINDNILSTINGNQFTIQFIVDDYQYVSGTSYPKILWSTNDYFSFYTQANDWDFFRFKISSNSRPDYNKQYINNNLISIKYNLSESYCEILPSNIENYRTNINASINANDLNINSHYEGGTNGSNTFSMKSLKIYNKILTDKEIKENYKIDKIRYNID